MSCDRRLCICSSVAFNPSFSFWQLANWLRRAVAILSSSVHCRIRKTLSAFSRRSWSRSGLISSSVYGIRFIFWSDRHWMNRKTRTFFGSSGSGYCYWWSCNDSLVICCSSLRIRLLSSLISSVASLKQTKSVSHSLCTNSNRCSVLLFEVSPATFAMIRLV